MQTTQQLLLEIWRETCRHIELSDSAVRVARRLARVLPLAQLHVRRLDLSQSGLETVAAASLNKAVEVSFSRTPFSSARLKRFLAWAAKNEPTRRGKRQNLRSELQGLLPEPGTHDLLAGPLRHGDEPVGVLVLVAPPGEWYQEEHSHLMARLLEPFSVALENYRRLQELTALREAAEAERRSLLTRLGRNELAETIVGGDAGLRPVMERVLLVARSDAPVVLLGETGTGKEVIARAIHTRSPRAQGPFIRVNCGAIPAELVDAQLFGHERGSFTGAEETRHGWFERANGGTLFLDEIGELPLAAQVRLLRVLQDGTLERVGGAQPLHVDVRIVTATHRDLAGMVTRGEFREDLWYRIAVFPILLPPLRERKEDVPALACHFAERAARRFGLPLAMPTPEDLRVLRTYNWPGNIRELGAVIDRAAILGNGRRLEVAKALGVRPEAGPHPAPSMNTGGEHAIPESGGSALAGSSSTRERPLSLDELASQHIAHVLTLTRGRVEGPQGAAQILRIHPNTLRAKMRKLGIDWTRYKDPLREVEPAIDRHGNFSI